MKPDPSLANILLVDDRPANLHALEAVLEPLGQNLVRANSGEEALRWLLSHDDCAVILLDVQMPGMDGFETASLIKAREKTRFIPIIFVTAISKEQHYIFQGYEAGAVDYISKPFDPTILKSKVTVFVDLFRKSEEIKRQAELLRQAEAREAERRLQEREMQLERQRMEELSQSEARLSRFKRTLDATLDCVKMFDPETLRFTYVNDGALAQLGYSDDEMLEMTPLDIFPEFDEASFRRLIAPLLDGTLPSLTFETTERANEGVEIPAEVFLQFIAQGDMDARFVAMVRDISERKQAEQIIQREAARTEALMRVASQLNAQRDLGTLLNTLCAETVRTLNVPAAAVLLCDAAHGTLLPAAMLGLPDSYRERYVPTSIALYEENAQREGSVIVVPDVQAVPDLPNAGIYREFNIRTIVSASLRCDGRLLATLNVYSFGQSHDFSDSERALLQGLADQATTALENTRLFEEAARRLSHLQALRNIDMAISGSLDLRVTLNVFLEQVATQLHMDAADVLVLSPHTHTLEYAAGRGFRTGTLQHTALALGEGHAGQAALERRIISIPDLADHPGTLQGAPLIVEEGFVSYYAVPLITKGQVAGVMEVFHRTPFEAGSEWLSFMETLAGQAAIAVDNATLFDDLQRSNTELTLAYDSTIKGWSRALDLRDKETEGHSQRVTDLTVRLARKMGIGDGELMQIRRGALLHDIGKMGVPDGILLKPGPLDDEEWVIMRRHPMFAFELLSPIPFLRPALDIPYCHHEKWDGSGYPRGLKEDQIPLSARIFAIVDVWDALRSDRPYRAGWSADKALSHIVQSGGTHFDPQVVQAFQEMER